MIVGGLHGIVEESCKACTVGLVVPEVQQLVWPHESIALPDGITDIGLRQEIVKTGQHLVDALSDGIKGELVDDIQIGRYLRHEESQRVEAVERSLSSETGQQRVGMR